MINHQSLATRRSGFLMIRKSVSASAPGKIILSGEHFVVHGSYSVAAAINKRVLVKASDTEGKSRIVSENEASNLSTDDGNFRAIKSVARTIISRYDSEEKARFELSVASEIPPGSGLGSSAAVAVATAAALSGYLGLSLSKKEISEIAFEGEKSVHGNPSGLDNQACLYGGLVLFKKGNEVERISLTSPFHLLVVYSGKKRSTGKLVRRVGEKRERFPNYFLRLATSASGISFEVAKYCKSGDLEKLGSLFTTSQAQLSWIGVSTEFIDDLIESVCESDEVFGAKITGAGGGGSIIAAVKRGYEDVVLCRVSKRFPVSFVTEIPQEGLRWEKNQMS